MSQALTWKQISLKVHQGKLMCWSRFEVRSRPGQAMETAATNQQLLSFSPIGQRCQTLVHKSQARITLAMIDGKHKRIFQLCLIRLKTISFWS